MNPQQIPSSTEVHTGLAASNWVLASGTSPICIVCCPRACWSSGAEVFATLRWVLFLLTNPSCGIMTYERGFTS